MTEVKNESGEKEKQPSVLACLKSLVVNRYWMIMVVFLFCLYFIFKTNQKQVVLGKLAKIFEIILLYIEKILCDA